jgi:hypothetical protein
MRITSKSHRCHRSECWLAFLQSRALTPSRSYRRRRSRGPSFTSTSPRRSLVATPLRRPPWAPSLPPSPLMTK